MQSRSVIAGFTLAVAASAAVVAPALADYEDTYFPLAQGNEWTYAESGFGASAAKLKVSIDQKGTGAGATWFHLLNYNGGPHWVRQTAANRVAEWQTKEWYRLDASTGSTWSLSMEAAGTIPGSNGAKLAVVSRTESVTVPAGTFTTVHLRFTTGVADAGITDEWFARGVGLVKRSQQTFGGPRVASLERATISGKTIGGTTPPAPSGSGAFGIAGTIPAARVRLKSVFAKDLGRPTALAFHPSDGSLFILNSKTDSSVVVEGFGTPAQKSRLLLDDSHHFLHNGMALAFSRSRNEFGTVQDTANDYGGHHAANNFMGPTLWPGDKAKYTGGTASHLDMLHHSPNSMGIAAGAKASGTDKREYWVFNGKAGVIDRYFFNEPHVPGGDDHHDGLTFRYGSGLRRVANVPGNLALDTASGVLYIADTGNGRIARLDTTATNVNTAKQIAGYHDETPLYQVPGSKIESVTTNASGLTNPTGLLLKNGKLVVSDHATGSLRVFSKAGALEGAADTGLGYGALTGIAESPGGKLHVLDAKGNRVLEVEILP